MNLYLYNSLSKKKELFIPLNEQIKMYVCGPTVYNIPHIGNARSIVIYDILFRLLNYIYEKSNVIYVRNITDVDDKINKAATEQNTSIKELTKKITSEFHYICNKLNCLSPDIEPKATDHIEDMILMIEALIESGNAYISNNHVYYNIKSFDNYGKLCGRTLEDMLSGFRIDVSEDKKYSGDFVLWKPVSKNDDKSSIWNSPWGYGRPGWHIECSAMSNKYLGANFDIHGGGIDLIFPHHTNEIAQSCAANKGSIFAKYWIHNGFLTVRGEKMSKSLDNFITVHDLLDKGIKPEVIRYLLLSTNYRKPLDFNDKLVTDSRKALDNFYSVTEHTDDDIKELDQKFIEYLTDDLNTVKSFSRFHQMSNNIKESDDVKYKIKEASILKNSLQFVGLLCDSSYFQIDIKEEEIELLVKQRTQAKIDKDWQLSDQIRQNLQLKDVILEDKIDGSTVWKIKKF